MKGRAKVALAAAIGGYCFLLGFVDHQVRLEEQEDDIARLRRDHDRLELAIRRQGYALFGHDKDPGPIDLEVATERFAKAEQRFPGPEPWRVAFTDADRREFGWPGPECGL